jgi:transcriptional regulator with XRE-family HTH domain
MLARGISSRQIKAARALLDWSQEELANAAKISVGTIRKLEAGSISPRSSTNNQIRNTLEAAGLEFIEPNGVRQKPEEITIYEGHEGTCAFFDEVYVYGRDNGGEIVTVCVNEDLFTKALGDYCQEHLARMNGLAGRVEVKCILTDNVRSIPAPYCEYRSISKNYIDSVPFYIFGKNYAVFLFGTKNSPKIVVHHSAPLADAYRKQFHSMWQKATPIFVPERHKRANAK